jgi:predicted nucleic acid-binding protein
MKTFTGSEPLFIDTWGWLVLAKEKDPSFREVARLSRQSAERGGRWITSDYVLDEALTRLFAGSPFQQAKEFFEAIFDSKARGSLIIETINSERFQAAWRLRLRYKDKPRISFTDLTSFVVMRQAGIRHVLTGDAHFARAGLGFHILP